MVHVPTLVKHSMCVCVVRAPDPPPREAGARTNRSPSLMCGDTVPLGGDGEAFVWREEVGTVEGQTNQITVMAWVRRAERKRKRGRKQGLTTCGPPSSRKQKQAIPRLSLRQGADQEC